MALIKCPECVSDISDKAASCPKCGYPIVHTGPERTETMTAPPDQPAEERMLFEIHPSRRPIIAVLALTVLYFLVFWLPAHQEPFGGIFTFALWLLLLGAGVMQWKRAATIYTLTSERVKLKAGIIGRVEKTIPLSKIQNVTSGYSVSQRLLGIGNVVIESAGERSGRVYMLSVDSPVLRHYSVRL